MSSSDIFDVLNIKHKSKSPINSSTPGPAGTPSAGLVASRGTKPQVTGMQRELYNLLGENQPPIMVQSSSRFKEKLASTAKPSPWTSAAFKPNKHVTLHHWIKGSKELIGEEPQQSSFAKFDQHLTLPEFTKEEYENFMNANKVTDNKQNKDTKNIDDELRLLEKNASKEIQVKQGTNDKEEGEKNKQETKVSNEEETTSTEVSETDKEKEVETTISTEDIRNKNKVDNDEGDGEEVNKDKQVEGLENKKGEELNKNSEEEANISVTNKTVPWEFEEVDYLFNLCRTYDLRWFVIHDRFNYGTKRSLEDLKDKFYEVSRKYFAIRNAADPLLESLNFPKQKENERKIYLQRLLSRSAAEIAEEEALIIESRKFEMAAKKTLNERESLLRLLDSPNSDQSVAQYLTSQGMSQLYNNLLSDKSRKRKPDSSIPENPWMKQQQQFAQQKQQLQQMQEKKTHELNNSQSPRKTKKQKLELQNVLKRKSESQYAEHLLKSFNEDERKALGVVTHGEKLQPGVYLRSTKISTFKPALQNKVGAVLQELGLPIRPAMPSQMVIEKEEELLKKIVTLIDLKKHLDKLETEKTIVN